MFLKDNNTNNTNGYHHQPPPEMVHNHTNRDRARRVTRRSRVSTSNSLVRVSDTAQPQQLQQSNRSPCTDYDMAYFHSYAHLGIHQEMIKVLVLSLFCYFLLGANFHLYLIFEKFECHKP